MHLRAVLAASLLPIALAAPFSPDSLARWSTKIVNSVTWIEGSGPIPDQLLVGNAFDEKQTIYEVLKSRDEFSRLTGFIDKNRDVKELLDDKERAITFFAPNNEALEKVFPHQGQSVDKGDREEYVKEMLLYSVLPEVIEYDRFGQNSTLATEFHAHDGSFGGYRRRLKVQSTALPFRRVKINNYAVISQSDIRARNGVIQKIDAPVFLPPDVMDALFLLPTDFSTTTAALLKVNLQNEYEFNGHEKTDKQQNDRHGKGAPATTFFAPTNEAWQQLPKELLVYLFSPFGERTLRKLMAFHTIPSDLVFTEWSRKTKDDLSVADEKDLSFEWDRHYDSLIDQKLPVHCKKTKSRLPGSDLYNIELQAHGLYVRSWDNVAQNGAIHVLDDVLSPRQKEGIDKAQNTKDWEEWRDWLMEWSRDRRED